VRSSGKTTLEGAEARRQLQKMEQSLENLISELRQLIDKDQSVA
jgi:hypothetical protein